MTRETVSRWLEAYAAAWRGRNPDGAASLFTEDAVYRSSPFREPHVGHDGVRAYWTRATRDQRNLDLRLGTPIVEGDRVAVEWWASWIWREVPRGRCPAPSISSLPRTGAAASYGSIGTGRRGVCRLRRGGVSRGGVPRTQDRRGARARLGTRT